MRIYIFFVLFFILFGNAFAQNVYPYPYVYTPTITYDQKPVVFTIRNGILVPKNPVQPQYIYYGYPSNNYYYNNCTVINNPNINTVNLGNNNTIYINCKGPYYQPDNYNVCVYQNGNYYYENVNYINYGRDSGTYTIQVNPKNNLKPGTSYVFLRTVSNNVKGEWSQPIKVDIK